MTLQHVVGEGLKPVYCMVPLEKDLRHGAVGPGRVIQTLPEVRKSAWSLSAIDAQTGIGVQLSIIGYVRSTLTAS